MSTELKALIESLNQCTQSIPLVVVEKSRFTGVSALTTSSFVSARLPEEARAGWLLYAGFGAESHAISQKLNSKEGSYWHGIYHRMEPDPWNAKYWFRQVGDHPILNPLLTQSRSAGWNPGRNWDHSAFVDFVGEAISSQRQDRIEVASHIQWLEWRLLFEYCVKEFSQ